MFKQALIRHRTFNLTVTILTIVYALIMIRLLFLRGGQWEDYNYNLIPLKTISIYITERDSLSFNVWFTNIFGNIVLFIPIGWAVPVLFRRFLKFLPFCLLVIGVIFLVELIQMLTRVGSFDVDDIILNTFGASIGFVITRIVTRFFFHKRSAANISAKRM